MSLLPFCEWLATTRGSIALHESLYVYPLVESTHVLTLCLFVGMTVLLDLRLLGLTLRRVPVSQMMARIIPLMLLGFVVMATTGLLLFYAIPVRSYQSVFLRLKMITLVLAGINAGVFHTTIRQRVAGWDQAAVPPRAARVAGIVSLACWTVVIATGRLAAYNWFDCDMQPQSAFINWAAECKVDQVEPR